MSILLPHCHSNPISFIWFGDIVTLCIALHLHCFKLNYGSSGFVYHDDVIKWKHFPRYCPFVRGIHRPPVDSSHKGKWRGALVFSLDIAWINCWVNNGKAGDLRRHCAHYDVIVMWICVLYIYTPRAGHDCHHSWDVISKCIFVEENLFSIYWNLLSFAQTAFWICFWWTNGR